MTVARAMLFGYYGETFHLLVSSRELSHFPLFFSSRELRPQWVSLMVSLAGSSGFLNLFKGLVVADHLAGSKLYCWHVSGHLDGWGHSSPIHLATYPHIPSPSLIKCPSTHQLIYHPWTHMHPPTHPHTCASSIYPPIYPSIYLAINPSIHLSFHESTHSPIRSSISILFPPSIQAPILKKII